MKPIIIALSAAAMLWPAATTAETVHVATPSTSLVVKADTGKQLKFMHYGERLSETDLQSLRSATPNYGQAYPVYGRHPMNETAMSVVHPDGNMTCDMIVDHVSSHSPADGQTVTTISLKDKYYPFFVDVNYLTYDDEDVIETWVEAWHTGKKPMQLTRFDSAYLPIHYGDVWLTQLYGAWANEGRLEQTPLNHGMRVIKNKDGVRNSHHAHSEVMLSLDGRPRENSGRVIGAALCYSGNYEIRIDTDHGNYHRLYAGINPDNSAYTLERGDRFITPPLALTYSGKGHGQASRNFHHWARNHKIAHGTGLRKVLLNSWEGVYLDIKEPEMHGMIDDIASMGGELFVMDDGWFGDKFHRDVDNAALGDWTVDTRKLPNGIQGLIDKAHSRGIKFGIWIEPEMTNTASRLYEQHPEYIIAAAHRDTVKGRGGTQVTLDMSNPKVQDLVFHVVDTLMTKYPGIDYIKWDANEPILIHGSQYLPADRQSHLYIEYHKGLAKTLDRIRAKYPDVTIQACASGGGRANYGIMPWFDEFWTSDNTDALQRIYMQWGTGYFFPAVAMGSHISAAPNHQTSRTTPLKYRIDVAMSGRLGMEIQPSDMTDSDKEQCRKAIAQYKDIRHIVQQGDLYRLLSPYDRKGAASLMYVDPNSGEAVFFWWKTESFCNEQLPLVTMDGLDPDRIYTVTELNRIDRTELPFEGKKYTGRFLMSTGLEMPLSHNIDNRTEYASRVLRITPVE
ncbi:MAG: alpha-galactosidase [Muribaculaceae bacterium]|nr:alpha-galactosidase [Muribaculaceae bacterium]